MDPLKRQDIPTEAALYVVATPIGNLEDFSPRGKNALATCHTVLAEDTRRTRTLLSTLGLSTHLERWDAHSTSSDAEKWIERIQSGQSIALVTDAGTPGVSDPGALLVELAFLNGIRVIPIPGASAVTAFVSVSAFRGSRFEFHGFFPRISPKTPEASHADLETLLQGLASESLHVFFESPHRIRETLQGIARVAPESPVRVAKELTKIHERIFVGTALSVSQEVSAHLDQEGERGEWVLGIIREKAPELDASLRGDWVQALECLLAFELPPSRVAQVVSQKFGVNRKIVYEKILSHEDRVKKSPEGA